MYSSNNIIINSFTFIEINQNILRYIYIFKKKKQKI